MDNKQLQNDKIDLMKYLDRFFRAVSKLKVYLILILIASIAFFEVKEIFLFNTTYTASSLVVITSDESENVYTSSDEDMVATFTSLIRGNMMQDEICKYLHTTYVPASISISSVTDTNLLKITCTSSKESDAFNVINTLIHNYANVTGKVMSDIKMIVLDQPVMPTSPDAYPNYILSGIKGLLGGLLAGSFIALCYAIIRHTILNNEDVNNVLGLNNIAMIPYIPGNSKNSRLLITNQDSFDGFKQSFRDIRLSIEQDHSKNNHQVYMVTSSLPNEGKSVVSSNIALSLAKKGYKTILIDLDLRNPSILTTLNKVNLKENVESFLIGKCELDDVVVEYDDCLDVIFGYSQSKTPTELLSKARLQKAIQVLREHYDYIIIDVPPIAGMQDASLVAKISDKAIIVVKQDYASGYDILNGLEDFNYTDGLILGTVLNQVTASLADSEKRSYSYGYGYGYGYGKRKKS